jgi:hypothetical protein
MPFPSFTTTRLIENFNSKRELEGKAKVEQLCQFKQNYLNNYTSVKYLMCLVGFLLVVALPVSFSVYVFRAGQEFQQGVDWNKRKLQKTNVIARDIS